MDSPIVPCIGCGAEVRSFLKRREVFVRRLIGPIAAEITPYLSGILVRDICNQIGYYFLDLNLKREVGSSCSTTIKVHLRGYEGPCSQSVFMKTWRIVKTESLFCSWISEQRNA
jgi:hypothetical protein